MNRKIILAGAAAVVLAASALAAAYFYIPGGVRPSFDEGVIRVCLNDGGTIGLDWPEAHLGTPAESRSDAPAEDQRTPASGGETGLAEAGEPEKEPEIPVFYDVDAKSGDKHAQKFQSYPGLDLADMALPMEVKVRAAVEGKNLLGMTRIVYSQALEATVEPAALNAPEVVATPEPGNLSLSWKLAGGAPNLYEIFTVEDGAAPRMVASASGKELDLKVGRDGDTAMPAYGRPLNVQVRAAVQGDGYVLCGPASNQISVERQDLLGDELNLGYQETDPRVFTLEWDETRGEYYELQEWSQEGWTLLDTLEPAERFTYELGRLRSGSHHRLQVVAKDRNGTVRSSEEVEFFASIDPLYATVWPIIDQEFYERADKSSSSLGKIPGGTALCVLEEQGDWFQVRYKDKYGYVDSRFCMINLPEYVGDHCEYDITNSYSSIFKVHENPIALITDQVVSGFEHIQEADGGFLVPYLYPCSKKLLSAAQAAEADGYRLKIYEAFRPNEATRFLYDTTAAQLEWAALVYDDDGNAVDPVTGWMVDLADGLLTDPETNQKVSREELQQQKEEEEAAAAEAEGLEPVEDEPPGMPDDGISAESPDGISGGFIALPEEGTEDEGGLQPAGSESGGSQAEPGDQPQEEETPEEEPLPEYDTYFKIMTNNGRFRLGSFLAQVTSAHNRGIALDLTLEKIDNGEELEMQSTIHDLSWYSATYLNNDNAKLLEKYMTATGMRGLTSEWWHFQDDETRESIGLSSYLYKGVDMGGWTRDDQGWRYRDVDGSFYRDTTLSVDGKRCVFDRDGYLSE